MQIEDGKILLSARFDESGRLLAAEQANDTTIGPSESLAPLLVTFLRRRAPALLSDGLALADLVRRLEAPAPCQIAIRPRERLEDTQFLFTVMGGPDGHRHLLITEHPGADPAAGMVSGAPHLPDSDILQTIIDLLPATISIKDAQRRYLFINRRWEAYAGLSRATVLGHRHEDLQPTAVSVASFQEHTDAIRARDETLLRTGTPVLNRDERYVDQDGVERTLLSSKVPLASRNGTASGILSITVDITEQKQAMAALAVAKAQAEEASSAKSRFLAAVSHELRTPLQAIIGFADLLLAETREPDRHESLGLIREAGQQLLELINDILDLSEVAGTGIGLEERPFPIAEALTRMAGQVHARAAEKGLRMDWAVSDSLPPVLVGDERKFRRILLNLLDNAIKFTQAGGISVAVSVTEPAPAPDHPVGLTMTVQDTGSGIDPADLSRIFEPFERAGTGLPAEIGGTGLGLTIAKRLAALMGGDLQVDSEPGRGTCVTFTCRFRSLRTEEDRHQPEAGAGNASPERPEPSARTGPTIPRGPPPATGSILIVGDDPYSEALLTHLLKASGYRTAKAHTRADAVRQMEKTGADLLVIDVQQPERVGLDVARLVRSGRVAGTPSTLPIVALTDFASRDAPVCCRETDVDGCLTKPMDRGEVLDLVARLLAEKRGTAHPACSPEVPLDKGRCL